MSAIPFGLVGAVWGHIPMGLGLTIILLTSLTTFFGLLPLLLERSLQARFLIPMAVSLGFGVVFATGISLILVPSGYVIAEDLKAGLQRLWGGSAEPAEEATGGVVR